MEKPNNWTLFLDRDGVINQRLPGAYVASWSDFHFLPGVLGAIAFLSKHFQRIIVVTNQQGIGKGLMTEEQLLDIHQQMKAAIEKAGGRIDGIYFCPDLATKKDHGRKPRPDMALQAQKDFPEINFSQSVMVGDSISDIRFGQNMGMMTVLVTTKEEEKTTLLHEKKQGLRIDLEVDGLDALTAYLPSLFSS